MKENIMKKLVGMMEEDDDDSITHQ